MNLGHIGSGIVVTLLPGLACLVWLERPRRDLPGYLTDALGLSISITALLGLVFFLLGVAPGAIGTAFIYGICLATLAAALVYKGVPRVERRTFLLAMGGLLAASAAVGALIWFRLYQARDLALPSWVNSVHHTLIVRLILERGGLPENFLPYLDARFSYHYGFHLLASHFASWAQLPPEQTVLVFGQALNGLISLALYRFARAAGLDWRAAALAGLLAGFVIQMPAYYITWGRYTLSTGLIVLLCAMSCALEFKDRPTDRRVGLRLALLTAGVCLTHYLATLLLIFFYIILGLFGFIQAARRRDLRAGPWRMAAWALAGGLAALPWLARMIIDNQSSAVIRGLKTVVTAADWSYLINLIGPRYNHILMILAAVGLLFGLRRRKLWSFTAWSLILLFLAQPFAIRLGPFRPDLYAIVLFVPSAIFLGALIADGAGALGRKTRPWLGSAVLIFTAALLLVWGVRETRSILNNATVIANKADLQALEWVRANTPADARFYINTAAWLGSTNRGVDGGYWLLPFAGRFSLVPPALYVLQSSDKVRQINDWAEQAKGIKGCNAEFWTIVSQARLTHVYVRQGRGSLQADALDQCPRLRLLYREAGISIYEIEQLN